ncbi:MAG TPA: ATP-binding cassette domain-containing protein [Acidimicrobiales bacterium]|nr:ATP-binding cassette domain-containing protein [Acidimicrobiales bacterium]
MSAGGSITLDGVTKTFPGSSTPAVAPLDLEVPAGALVVLIGPSGCGKTTTLRMVNRLIEPTAGTITIDGRDIRTQSATELRRGIGYVIQQVGLFPHRTVAQNIATVPRLLGWDRARTAARVDELTELVGLDPSLLRRYPSELSGGQQQRVGVARALAADPPVLLMDEPFGAVDPIVRGRLQRELLDLQAKVRKTIVLVTHDIDEAVALGDQVAVLNVGGVLEQYAPPDELLAAPANAFVASFLGAERSIKRLALATVASLDLDGGHWIDRSATVAAAEEVLARTGSDWLGLVEDGRFAGWVSATEVAAAASLGDLSPVPPAAKVRAESSLREALEVILTQRTPTAVVEDAEGRFRGLVQLEAIRQGLAR